MNEKTDEKLCDKALIQKHTHTCGTRQVGAIDDYYLNKRNFPEHDVSG